MTKLYAYVVAALVAVVGVGGLFWWGQQGHQKARQALADNKVIATQRDDALEALRLSNRAAEVNRQLSQKRIAVAESQRKAAEKRAKELDRALKDNPDWASSPVPDGVWDALGPAQAAGDPKPAASRAAR